MTEALRISEEQDLLAAELAFGLLDSAQSARAEQLRRDDAGFDAAVRRWQAQTVAEMKALTPIAPPAALWQRIEAATAPGSNVLPFDASASDAKLARRLAFWRGSALVGGALAAGLALLMVVRGTSPAPTEPAPIDPAPVEIAVVETRLATVQVVGTDDQPIATAVFDQAAGTMRVKLDVADAADVVPEFWVIPEGGKPQSLGRTAKGDVPLTGEQQQLVFAGGAFAVSLEPDDGETSATPRGMVLGAGAIQLL
jgi:anti-sigma-K factor RskA